MNYKKYIPAFFVAMILLCTIGVSIYYTFLDQTILDVNNFSGSDTRREEIQRFFGYEPLLSRYLTLPYDISLNTNQHGSFVDIGFLYIILLPLILIAFLQRTILKLVAIFILSSLFIISIHNSFVLVGNIKVGASEVKSISTFEDANIVDKFLASIYALSDSIYQPFGWFIDLVSGDQDHISYPIVISSFLLFLYLFYQVSQRAKSNVRYLPILVITYAFFFLTFSSGIIWYGYLLFPLMIIGIMYFAQLEQTNNSTVYSTVRAIVGILSLFWILIGLMSRVSNIQANMPTEHQGKSIIVVDTYYYNTGLIKSEPELQDKFITPKFSETINRINSNPSSKILKIGTGLTYFIDNNHERIIFDNQVGLFSNIIKNYKNKYVISDFLKASGIKFLIIDLNTASIDNTPERTLTRKFSELLSYISNNESLRLLCTDNLTRQEGTNKLHYSLIGETVRRGNFVIYEIN